MLDDDLDLLADVVGMEAHPAHDPLQRRVLLDFLLVPVLAVVGQAEGQLVGRVVPQHVEDEALLDGLAHRIDVEGAILPRLVLAPEQLHGFGLGGGGEGDVGDALVARAARHLRGQDVLVRHLAAVAQGGDLLGGQDFLQLGRGLAGLTGVGLVGDDGEGLALGRRQFADLLQRIGEGLDSADDDLLSGRQRLGQLAALRPALALDRLDHARHALEIEQGFLELGVDDVAVGHDDDAAEQLVVVGVVQFGQEVRRPGDGVGFARPGRVLDQEAPARPLG
ncbi:hypothetical protein D3C72_426270 [compost metagenome]